MVLIEQLLTGHVIPRSDQTRTTSIWNQHQEISLWSGCHKWIRLHVPSGLQTTSKRPLVPWMEFGLVWAMLCWDIFSWLTRKPDFPTHFPPGQPCLCVVVRHQWLLSTPPLLLTNVRKSATLTSWRQCEQLWQQCHTNISLEFNIFNSRLLVSLLQSQ